jgi:hypothetical protein
MTIPDVSRHPSPALKRMTSSGLNVCALKWAIVFHGALVPKHGVPAPLVEIPLLRSLPLEVETQ